MKRDGKAELDAAVDRARGVVDSVVDVYTSDDIERLILDGKLDISERFLSLKEGQKVEGQLLGQGITELPSLDPREAGVLRPMLTWHFRHATGQRFSLVGSTVLDRSLPDYLGRSGSVVIARGAKKDTGTKGRSVTDYFVAGPMESAAWSDYFVQALVGGAKVAIASKAEHRTLQTARATGASLIEAIRIALIPSQLVESTAQGTMALGSGDVKPA